MTLSQGEAGDGKAGVGEARVRVPVAARRPVVHEAHGVRRDDDYAWLRDTADPEVLAHLREERDHYDRASAHLEHLRVALAEEMTSATPVADSSVRWRHGAFLYYTEVLPGEEHPRLFRQTDESGDATLLLDPNLWLSEHGHVEVGLVEPSPDGRLLAYSVDTTGEEVYELRFRDVASGADLPDVVPRTYYGGAWSADGAYFFYTVHDEAYRPDTLKRHCLGTDPGEDAVVLHEPDRRFEVDVAASRDGGWVVVTLGSRDTSEVHLVDARAPLAPPRLVAARRAGVEYAVTPLPGGWDARGEDAVLVVTDDGAPEFRLCLAPLPAAGTVGSAASWVPVPEASPGGAAAAGAERLVSAAAFARHVVLTLRGGGEPFLRVLRRGGPPVRREIHPGLPFGQVSLWRNEDYAATAVVVVEENLVTPQGWVRVDLDTGTRSVLKRTAVPGADLSRYVTTRIEATSADGVRVPVTTAHLRERPADGFAGCLLYGYGAYESCEWPAFSVAHLALLDRGVVYAVAHVRGGGEGGRSWWQHGRLRSKQTTFDDFVAARAAVVSAGLAPEGGVVSRGLSAGGLLQGAVFSQAPTVWAGVVAEVPFVDVVTSMSDPTIPLTENEWDEWGDPVRSPEDFAAMLAYSPYDNPPPTPRPPLLVTGALHDPRVLVHEPAKWVARLRATDDAAAPSRLLFRVELGEGAHSGPSGRWSQLRYEAEVLTFVLDCMGLSR